MNIKYGYLYASAILSLITPTASQAATFIEARDKSASLPDIISSDLYFFGDTVSVNKNVTQDAFVFGQIVALESDVKQDVYSAGQELRLTGSVGDDAHLAGELITVDGDILGDAFIAGQKAEFNPESSVRGDLYISGQDIVINGKIDGTVRVSGKNITVGPKAVIKGDLLSFGSAPTVTQGAVIEGKTEQKEMPSVKPYQHYSFANFSVLSIISAFILAFALLYFLPSFSSKALRELTTKTGRSILTGVLWVFFFIPVSIVLIITIIGIPLAAILGFITVPLLILAKGYATLIVGYWLMSFIVRADKKKTSTMNLTWPHALLGAFILEAIMLLGGIGFLIITCLVIWALGAVVQTLWHHVRIKTV